MRDLSTLLKDAAAEPVTTVDAEEIWRAGRWRRRGDLIATTGAATAALLAIVFVALPHLPPSGPTIVDPVSRADATSGVLPDGWSWVRHGPIEFGVAAEWSIAEAPGQRCYLPAAFVETNVDTPPTREACFDDEFLQLFEDPEGTRDFLLESVVPDAAGAVETCQRNPACVVSDIWDIDAELDLLRLGVQVGSTSAFSVTDWIGPATDEVLAGFEVLHQVDTRSCSEIAAYCPRTVGHRYWFVNYDVVVQIRETEEIVEQFVGSIRPAEE